MWWFIGLIVLVAIIFGISLHEAFWGIVAVVAALCAVGWAFGTESGKKFVKWCLIIGGVIIGAILVVQGISKKINDAKIYEDDVGYCQLTYTGYYQDPTTNMFVPKSDICINQAASRSKTRNDWWLLESLAGATIVIFAFAIWGGDRMQQSPKSPSKKVVTRHKSAGNR